MLSKQLKEWSVKLNHHQKTLEIISLLRGNVHITVTKDNVTEMLFFDQHTQFT